MPICKICTKKFVDTKHPSKFLCSRKCSSIYRRTIPTKACPTCNKQFRKNTIHCSAECAKHSFGWSRGKIFTKLKKNCKVCGKEFETVPTSKKQHTCSRKCSFIYRTKRPYKKICKYCYTVFETMKIDSEHCSRSCGTRKRWKNHIYKIHPHKVIPREKMKKCSRCGFSKYPQILERHHKDRNRSNNNESNFEILCPNCHDIDHFLNKDGRQFATALT